MDLQPSCLGDRDWRTRECKQITIHLQPVVAKSYNFSKEIQIFTGILPNFKYWLFYQSARAAITEYHSGLNIRHLFSHSSRDQKSKIKLPAGWFLMRPFFLACRQMLFFFFFLCTHMPFPLCACKERQVSDGSSSSYEDPSPVGSGPTLLTLFNHN